MKKRCLALMAAGLGTALLLTACGHIGNIMPDSKVKLDPNKQFPLLSGIIIMEHSRQLLTSSYQNLMQQREKRKEST